MRTLNRRATALLLGAALACLAGPAQAVDVRFQRVAEGVCAHIGDKGARTADTQAYRLALHTHMKRAVDNGVDVSAAVKTFGATPYLRLLNAAELMPGNASRTYLELERE